MNKCNNCPIYDKEKNKCKCEIGIKPPHSEIKPIRMLPRGSQFGGCPTEEEKVNGFEVEFFQDSVFNSKKIFIKDKFDESIISKISNDKFFQPKIEKPKNCNNCPIYNHERKICENTFIKYRNDPEKCVEQQIFIHPMESLPSGCPTEEEKENGLRVYIIKNKPEGGIEEKTIVVKGKFDEKKFFEDEIFKDYQR